MIYRADLSKKKEEAKPSKKNKHSLMHIFKKKETKEKIASPIPVAPAPVGYMPSSIQDTENVMGAVPAASEIPDEVLADVAPQKAIRAAGTPRPKKKFNFKLLFGLIFLFFLVLGGLFAYDRISSYSSRVENFNEDGSTNNVCDNILNPSCWTEAFRPQLKSTDGYTSVLIIGTDTRSGSSGLMNTDSIIVLTFNQTTGEYMMTSIPRDFWSFSYSAKINAVYAYSYKAGKADHNDEFYYLKKEIGNVVGHTINYMVKVRFTGVTQLVDTLGGVEVCPTSSFTAKYPNDTAKKGDAQWLFYPFDKGCQTVNGEKALVYARFRYVAKGDQSLASDFSRARRQQEIIDSIKKKLLATDMTVSERAEKYWGLFQTLNQSIETDASFEDLLAAMYYIDKFDPKPLSIVLDPNFGGLNKFIYTDSNPTQGYTIKSKKTDYSNIKAELDNIWKYSAFYKESPKIVIRNQTGEKLASDSAAVTLKSTSYYSLYKLIDDTKSTTLSGIHIFDFTAGEKSRTLAYLEKYFGVTSAETLPEQYGIEQSSNKEDFLIVIGPDTLPTTTSTVTPTAE